jgi:hypothetical protein
VGSDREHDPTARPGELVGELDARGGGADHQHATLGQVGRIVVVGHGALLDRGIERGGDRRRVRHVAPAGRDHHGVGRPAAGTRVHPVPVALAIDGGDLGALDDRLGGVPSVAAEKAGDLGGVHESGRVRSGVLEAGQSAEPVRR